MLNSQLMQKNFFPFSIPNTYQSSWPPDSTSWIVFVGRSCAAYESSYVNLLKKTSVTSPTSSKRFKTVKNMAVGHPNTPGPSRIFRELAVDLDCIAWSPLRMTLLELHVLVLPLTYIEGCNKKIETGLESRKINKGEDNEVIFACLNPLSPLSMTVDKSASQSLFPPLK